MADQEPTTTGGSTVVHTCSVANVPIQKWVNFSLDEEIIALGQGVLQSATIQMYNKISNDLLPTPTRPHYTFNLRDLSSVFQGMTMATAGKIPDAISAQRLWIHECRRVFKDRLINETGAFLSSLLLLFYSLTISQSPLLLTSLRTSHDLSYKFFSFFFFFYFFFLSLFFSSPPPHYPALPSSRSNMV